MSVDPLGGQLWYLGDDYLWHRYDHDPIDPSPRGTNTFRLVGLSGVVKGTTPPPPPPPPPPGDWYYVLNEDFNTWSTPIGGTPTASLWNSKLGMGTGNDGSSTSQKCKAAQSTLDTYVRITDGGGSRGKVLSMRLPANSGSSNKGGTFWCNMPNPQDIDECIISYDLRFRGATADELFGPTWGYGGKLFGMGGVVRGTAPSQPSGCKTPDTVGWSGRQMWWGKGPNGKVPYSAVGSRPNLGVHYNYDWRRTDRCGDNFVYATTTSTTGSFKDRTWQNLQVHYKLNTPGQANGLLKVTLDNVVVRTISNWQPRSRADLHITHLWMHCFRGGDDSLWGVPKETFVDFDNLRISVPS